MKYWLMKSEPDAFSIDDLKTNQTEPWDGVRNYQARNMMRDDMKVGDKVFFYHSSCKQVGVVGLMTVSHEGYPDHTSWDPDAKYFDPKSDPQNPRWFMVDVNYERHLKRTISLTELKANPALENMALVKKGSRLSIMEMTQDEYEVILGME